LFIEEFIPLEINKLEVPFLTSFLSLREIFGGEET